MKNAFLILIFFSFCFSLNSCKKKPAVPALTTTDATEITQTTATSGGTVTDQGDSQMSSSGICWSSTEKPTVADKILAASATGSSFTSKLTELIPNNTYYIRAYATNGNGTGYGNQVMFTTSQIAVPEVTTREINHLHGLSYDASGTIISDNGSPITEKGICLGKSHNPTTSDTKVPCLIQGVSDIFTSFLPGETPNTTYYLRAYAINSVGTGYGNELTFTVPDYPLIFNPAVNYGTLSDPDNNIYKTVTIGTQIWMAENLRTSKFSDGTPVPLVSDYDQWGNLSTPGYCYFNNDEGFKLIYGALYNFYAVSTGFLCPTGWHVPDMAEITTLQNNLGGEGLAGGKLKETGTTHWLSPNETATNETGFTALPGQLRGEDGFFSVLGGESTDWWLSNSPDSYVFGVVNSLAMLENYGRAVFKKRGFGVRCLKN